MIESIGYWFLAIVFVFSLACFCVAMWQDYIVPMMTKKRRDDP